MRDLAIRVPIGQSGPPSRRYMRKRAAIKAKPSIFPLLQPSSWLVPGLLWPSMATGRSHRASGSADVLSALGVNIELSPQKNWGLHQRSGHWIFVCTPLPWSHETLRQTSCRNGHSNVNEYYGAIVLIQQAQRFKSWGSMMPVSRKNWRKS